MLRTLAIALLSAAALAGCGSGAAGPAAPDPVAGPVEQGNIDGWTGGDAVLYATVGFFSPNPQIVAVGSVRPGGSFSVTYPATLPPDVLGRPADQCPTIRATDPAALTAFTANDLVYQHGVLVAATHSGTSRGAASFTSIAGGDTRTGYVYADRNTTTSGSCERKISLGGQSVDFLQELDLPLRRGWNVVVARFSTPRPGQVVSELTTGSDRSRERFFLF